MISESTWHKALAGEMAWWEKCTDTSDEEVKQRTYATQMGLDRYLMSNKNAHGWLSSPYDLEGKSVLDIGGGPVSLLLKCRNLGRAVVVDPGEWPGWVLDRYKAAGIEYIQAKGEDFDLSGKFDEVWIYNVLQHVQDPAKVIENALACGQMVRLWEWLDSAVNEMHPHSLTAEWLDNRLAVDGQIHKVDWERYLEHSYTAVRYDPREEDKFEDHAMFLVELVNGNRVQHMAEIGVLRAVTSQQILTACPDVEQYLMIDPWEVYPEDQRTEDYWNQGIWDQVYKEACTRVKNFGDRVTILREHDWEAVKHIPDASLDLVFIDAFDTYDENMAYIERWLPKVKPGGILAGHDWNEKYNGLRQAVLKNFEGRFHVPDTAENWGNCWYVRKGELPNITVMITSTGRADLLKRTVDSLRATWDRGYRDLKIVISDDSPDREQQARIQEMFGGDPDVELFLQAFQRGRAWHSDFVYDQVSTRYLFHCEDDWEFLDTGYIEKSLDVLENHPDIMIVGLARDQQFADLGAVGERHETPNGTVFYDHPCWRIDEQHDWWHGWIGSPHLLRLSDYRELGSFSQVGSEAEYDKEIFGKSGKRSVWLHKQYVKHIGAGRSIWPVGAKVRNWLKPPETEPEVQVVIEKIPLPPRPESLRLHLLGLDHVPTHREISACAYTQKCVKLARMLKGLGHELIVYAGEGSDVECDELVQVVTQADRVAAYGDYNWRVDFFKHDGNSSCHKEFNRNAIREINARKKAGDMLLCPMGTYDKPIADAVGLTTIESGIGYRGVFAPYRVFESYSWMMYVYGLLGQNDGSWYDAVIPNYFDPADFPFQEEKQDYFLFIGRLVRRKGLDVAVQVTKEIGAKLIVAGQGWLVNKTEGLNITDSHVEHVGSVGPAQRAELYRNARACFVPTYYIGPFEGVAVEAQMTGTPVLTTDWGVFGETVLHGVTGYRCRTFEQFVWAARNVDKLNPQDCHDWAIANFSMDRVSLMYEEFLRQVDDVRLVGSTSADPKGRGGWYEPRPKRIELDWLKKRYPGGCFQGREQILSGQNDGRQIHTHVTARMMREMLEETG